MDSAPRYIFGAQALGSTWRGEGANELIHELDDHGIRHFDTAAVYPSSSPGASEVILGQKVLPGAIIDTKILFSGDGMFSRNSMESSIRASLTRLNAQKISTLYAHAPDNLTPIAKQAANFHYFHHLGLFDDLGLCNYTPAMVREWIDIANEKDYILPTIYQGQYNILCRGYEEELFPLLRKHRIAFAAISPLAGGFLTGKLTFCRSYEDLMGGFETAEDNMLGTSYRTWYDQPVFHDAMRTLQDLAEREDVTPQECAMRWLLFHSPLKSTDAIIIEPSTMEQLDEYLEAREAGPLEKEFADDIEELFSEVKTAAAPMLESGWWTMGNT